MASSDGKRKQRRFTATKKQLPMEIDNNNKKKDGRIWQKVPPNGKYTHAREHKISN